MTGNNGNAQLEEATMRRVIDALGDSRYAAHDLSTQIMPLLALNVGLSVPALIKKAAELQGARKRRKIN